MNAEALYLLFLSVMPHPVPLPMCRLIIEWSSNGELHLSPDGQCWNRFVNEGDRTLVSGGRVVIDNCDTDMYARLKAVPGTLGEYLGVLKRRMHGDLTEGWDE